MANKWMKELQKIEGAVDYEYDPYKNVIPMPTPSLGYVFAKSHGLPAGFSVSMYGPPGGGKSLLAMATAGKLHQIDESALIVKFNTEMRERGQITPQQLKLFGVDANRYVAYDENTPEGIFDRIEKEISALCDDGAPIKLIIIDSLTNISGRRALNSDSVMKQQIGDEALTLKDGLKRILPVLRRHHIALITTNQVRAELDPVEQMRGKTVKMAAAWATQHYIEYFLFVEKDKTKDGRSDLLGHEFIDEEKKDIQDKAQKTGFKVRFRMEKSSMGVDGRSGEMTWDFEKGIVNTHEEVFQLGVNLGIIKRPNNVMYAYGNQEFRGKETCLNAIRDDVVLYNTIWSEIRNLDK
jgi:RecA/RadA recombinase